MDDYKHRSSDAWEDWEYGTGRTRPPKSHGGILAILLILVIFLCGIVSALGIMNIRLFQKLNEEQSLPISFATEPAEIEAVMEATEAAPQMTLSAATGNSVTMDLQNTPQEEALPGLSLQEIYARNIPSVVSIICTLPSGSASGTGVILSEQGYIVTNYHVIENARSISVQLTDDRVLTAQVVGTDAVSDLAVLHIQAEDLTAAQFGDSDELRVGDTVVAIGDPLGVEFRGTMTDGIVSAINRDVTVNGRTLTLIQTNAALNSGNSGGPLINVYGQVVGINTMKIGAFTDNAGVEGLGFAIPSATVKQIVEELITQGYVAGRPAIGLEGEELSGFYQRFYRLPAGLYITQVDSSGPAAQCGIQSGDILVRIDDTAVTTMDSLNAILYSHAVGDTVTAVIYRSGRQTAVELTLTEARG